MGRHAIGSSPLRTPAVLVGVPVATVLATFGTTAVLGGVVPSAEEAPLRAEAPGEVVTPPAGAVPQGAPSAPAVSLDTPLLPTADAAPADLPEPVTSTASAVRPAAGPRLVRAAPAVAAPPRALDLEADDEHDDDPASTSASAPRRAAAPQLAPRAVSAASPADAVETTAQRSSGEGEGEGGDRTDADDSVVDLAGPSGGLSVLTFG